MARVVLSAENDLPAEVLKRSDTQRQQHLLGLRLFSQRLERFDITVFDESAYTFVHAIHQCCYAGEAAAARLGQLF